MFLFISRFSSCHHCSIVPLFCSFHILHFLMLFNAYNSNYNAKQLQNVAFYREVSSDLLVFFTGTCSFPAIVCCYGNQKSYFQCWSLLFLSSFLPREFLFITEHLLYWILIFLFVAIKSLNVLISFIKALVISFKTKNSETISCPF